MTREEEPTQECKMATASDLKESKRRCWWTTCKNTAWFEDWAGWHWCLKHLMYLWKSRELTIKLTRLRWPY